MFTITAEELNKLVYSKSCEGSERKHTSKYNMLRNRYANLNEEQFDELYRNFVGTSGVIGDFDFSRFHYDKMEAESVCAFMNDYIGSDFKSFTDMWEKFATDIRKGFVHALIDNDRLRKALYTICDSGMCPEIECFKVKTCGKTHIRMFRKKNY